MIFMSAGNAGLEPDREYLALLWPGGRATSDLIFPIVAGRVVSSEAGELNGMAVITRAAALIGERGEHEP